MIYNDVIQSILRDEMYPIFLFFVQFALIKRDIFRLTQFPCNILNFRYISVVCWAKDGNSDFQDSFLAALCGESQSYSTAEVQDIAGKLCKAEYVSFKCFCIRKSRISADWGVPAAYMSIRIGDLIVKGDQFCTCRRRIDDSPDGRMGERQWPPFSRYHISPWNRKGRESYH